MGMDAIVAPAEAGLLVAAEGSGDVTLAITVHRHRAGTDGARGPQRVSTVEYEPSKMACSFDLFATRWPLQQPAGDGGEGGRHPSKYGVAAGLFEKRSEITEDPAIAISTWFRS